MSLLITRGLGVSATPFSASLPYITNFSPETGSLIYSTSSISFDVLDPPEGGSFARIMIVANMSATLIQEIVHDGDSFGLMYRGPTNVTSSITYGRSYTILRDGGWTKAPILTPYAIDVSGSQNI